MPQDAHPEEGHSTPEAQRRAHTQFAHGLNPEPPSSEPPGATRPAGRESPRARARAMINKSASVRMLEEEGSIQSTYFGHIAHSDQSRVSEDMLVSLSCLTVVKNLQETGRFGEAQDELEKVLLKCKDSREQVMACLVLAELLNKWGAASPCYSIDIMERGAYYAANAVKMLEEMVDEAAVTDPLAPYSTDECLLRESRYWKVLNLATVASLGACAHTPVPSSCPSVQEGFQECDATLAALRGMRRAKGNTLAMKGSEIFVEATLLFCKGKALQSGHVSTSVTQGLEADEVWRECLKLYDEAYGMLSGAHGNVQAETVKVVTMLGVCNQMIGDRNEAIRWATLEVDLRMRLFGDWNPRTRKAQEMLEKLKGKDELSTDAEKDQHQTTSVPKEDIIWSLNPFSLTEQYRVSAVIAMFDYLGLTTRFSIPRGKLTAFVIKCRDSYRPENAFHNWCHAWSVTHCAYMIMTCSSVDRFLRANEILSIMISCLVHDIEHPGVNSDYLIKTGSTLALKFPYRNVLEHMHSYHAKKLFQDECPTDFLENVTPGLKEEILLLVHEGIMATDMQNHKAIVDSLCARCQRLDTEGGGGGGGEGEVRSNSAGFVMAYDIHNAADRLELVQAIVHASDLSGQVLDKDVAYLFGRGVLREFHNQSMREHTERLPLTPFMKNLDSTLMQAKAQLGFLNFVVEPLWNYLCSLFPEIKSRHDAVLDRLGEIDFECLEQWGGRCEGLPSIEEQSASEVGEREGAAKDKEAASPAAQAK
eukprot:Tamp_02781.p1 GENE.Tamp_02781~~Tamp_02781.p1  ORF type:complete len:782 (+),score=133.68 Tamp_02781:66-2348(+)